MTDLQRERFGGLSRIYGSEFIEKAGNFHVCIVGLGGVGSWACEALARSGIGIMTLVDLDDICITNTNRQIHATATNIGTLKVDAMEERIKSINPQAKIIRQQCFLNSETVSAILENKPDFVIDAIDSVQDKGALIKECKANHIPFVISGGAGGKSDSTKIKIADLRYSQSDSLLKSLKRELKKVHGIVPDVNGFFEIPCVFSTEPAILPWKVCSEVKQEELQGARLGCATGFGSVCHVTGAFGFALAGAALNHCRRETH